MPGLDDQDPIRAEQGGCLRYDCTIGIQTIRAPVQRQNRVVIADIVVEGRDV